MGLIIGPVLGRG